MLIRSAKGHFTTDSPHLFEYHWYQLLRSGEAAAGFDDNQQPVFLVENGFELLEPRRFILSGSAKTWLPPALIQVRALLSLFPRLKVIPTHLGLAPSITSRMFREGVSKYSLWRSLCELAGIPMEPFPAVSITPFQFGKSPPSDPIPKSQT